MREAVVEDAFAASVLLLACRRDDGATAVLAGHGDARHGRTRPAGHGRAAGNNHHTVPSRHVEPSRAP